jgi:hypothetical protein
MNEQLKLFGGSYDIVVVLALEKQAISFCLLYKERKHKLIESNNSRSVNITNNATFSNYTNQTVSVMNPNCRRIKIPILPLKQVAHSHDFERHMAV